MFNGQPRETIRTLRLISGVLFAFILILAAYIQFGISKDPLNDAPLNSGAVGQPIQRPLTDFTLPSNTGSPISLSDLRGNFVLLAFGYTSCPDVCPTTMLEFRQVKSLLGEDSSRVKFVFVSVDEARDTPEILNQFVTRFDQSFIGLQGNDSVLQPIKDEYGLSYDIRQNPDSSAGPLVEHTASKYLIDPNGDLIRIYSFATDAREIARELETLF